ncbi:MAG: hypothetical protein R3D60_01270 [Paracoccaceae bacterium]
MTLKTFALAAAFAVVAALPASAACYAEYRAQKTSPLQFHVGVAQIADSSCGNPAAAAQELGSRLGQNGWTLVDVLSTFTDEGLASRRQRAGQYFLRF